MDGLWSRLRHQRLWLLPRFRVPLANLEGTDILSGYPASTGTAHVLAFALSGKDPFTGTDFLRLDTYRSEPLPSFSLLSAPARWPP